MASVMINNNPNAEQLLDKSLHNRYLHRLKIAWIAWLVLRLALLPLVMMWVSNVAMLGAILWQMMVMLPALIATPFVLKSKDSYALIVISLVIMVYWAVAASFWLIYVYERAMTWMVIIYALETLLLTVVFACLLMGLKKMPAMHKNRRTS